MEKPPCPTIYEMVSFVRAFSYKNKNKYGWKIVEHVTDQEIAQCVAGASTLDGAATKVYREIVKPSQSQVFVVTYD